MPLIPSYCQSHQSQESRRHTLREKRAQPHSESGASSATGLRDAVYVYVVGRMTQQLSRPPSSATSLGVLKATQAPQFLCLRDWAILGAMLEDPAE